MKFIKIGDKGINLALVRSWKASQAPAGTSAVDKPFVRDGTFYDVLVIEYAGGGDEAFYREEATLLRQWLEANAEDISQEPPTAEIGPSPMEGYRG